ncbi:hypothetical protein, partial [Vibrio cholerae]|uniref:hypothetical protein n=1 Tax=Vibrio cholerae TaxID=666 RepID=UPI00069FB4B2
DFMNYFFLIIFKFSMSLFKIMKVSLHLLTSNEKISINFNADRSCISSGNGDACSAGGNQ